MARGAPHRLRCAQAISSETGKVIDDFTLKKAANFAPNITARNEFLGSGFQSTYQASFLEVLQLSITLPKPASHDSQHWLGRREGVRYQDRILVLQQH